MASLVEVGSTTPGIMAWEAENGVLSGGAMSANDWSGFRGAGFVDFQAPAGEAVAWTVAVQQTGRYAVGFRYALSASPRWADGRPLQLGVDGVDAMVLPFRPTGGFASWSMMWTEVVLPAGSVTLSLESLGFSGANIDQVLIQNVPVVLLNTAPVVTGTIAPITLAAGATATIATAAVVMADPDVRDVLTVRLTLAEGGPLPSFLTFDPATLQLAVSDTAPPGDYLLRLRVNDGKAASASSVLVAVTVQPGSTVPLDLDGDGIRNRRDVDDDNDGLLDVVDPFLADAANGRDLRIDAGSSVVLDFTTVPDAAPSGWGFGLTGLLHNGVATPYTLGLGSPALGFLGGALHIEDAARGTPGPDTLLYGAQFGVDPNARNLTISVVMDNPYDDRIASAGESFGLVIGTGNQDEYVRLLFEAAGPGRALLRTDGERAGTAWAGAAATYGIVPAALTAPAAFDAIRLTFEIDTVTGVARASWSIDTATGAIVGEGAAMTLGGALLQTLRGDGATGLAIGVSATSGTGTPLDLDVLEFRVEGSADPDIAVRALDASFMPDRLVFNWIDNPYQNKNTPIREYKGEGSVRITNSGDSVLELTRLVLDGPFRFLDASDLAVRSLAVGASLEVEIGFDRSAFTPPDRGVGALFDGELRVLSNDPDEAVATVSLGGWWQTEPEAGREPSLNEMLEAFGFGNRVDATVLNGGRYEKAAPEEVLAPYWKLAPGYARAEAIQLAAFKDVGQSTLSIHAPGNMDDLRSVLQQDELYNQSFLPIHPDRSNLLATFDNARVPDAWQGDDWFGIRSSGNSSDPTQNKSMLKGEIRGHWIRFLEAIDADGTPIANTYLVAVDSHGSNLDYNDMVYLITGIAPVADLLLV